MIIPPAFFYGSNVIDITQNRQVIQVYSLLVRSSYLKIANRSNNLLTTIIIDDPTTNYCRLMEDICLPMITRFDRLMFVFKDLSDFKHRVFRKSDVKNSNLARNMKCKFCDDFFGSQTAVQNNEVQAHRELMELVSNTSCRVKKLGCDSPTSDSKCQHRSACMLTSSQPLMTRTDTNQSCCPV